MIRTITGLMTVAGLAVLISGCNGAANDNRTANANLNANANATLAPTSTPVVNTNTNTGRAPTREEYDRDRERYQREAQEAGRTVGSGVNDGWLWVKTRFELAATDDLRDSTVNVDVENAAVTLTGTVASAAQKTRAEEVAKSVEGVTRVRNNLRVQSDNANANAPRANDNR